MSALWRGHARPAAPRLLPMTAAHLDAVMAVEMAAYAFPWSRGNFIDSFAAGHSVRVLQSPDGGLLGYFVAMAGVDEMHLLNITVAPASQGQGHARRLLDALVVACRACRAATLWLEVRVSNTHALSIYRHFGFRQIGVRKSYYPAPLGRREDALVMSLAIAPEGSDAVG